MNFLAHLVLSPPEKEIILGNFIADAVKGSTINTFSSCIQEGIQLHRKIDTYTDQHHAHRHSRIILQPRFAKFSGVITDIFFDHYLAKDWIRFSSENLETYTLRHYEIIEEYWEILPPITRKIFPFMKGDNWLLNYSSIDFLKRVFEGMSRRTRFKSEMEYATDFLLLHYNAFEEDFNILMPDLISFCSEIAISCNSEKEGLKN
ncbi:MAG: acyl carrier protein phosphodiesterase [Bacteroidales bacterium]|jgi:acyl carrier protein phosphodiesterase|nr:acyl carrier protein phosphodiesterase [Bacteroidales bacterium]